MVFQPLHLIGQRFGRLEVLREAGRDAQGRALWVARCDCGGTKVLPSGYLTSGNTNSCGCLVREANARRSTHRLTKTAEYQVWTNMKKRCHKSTHKSFKTYGARGIIVCDQWRAADGFAAFLADMGKRPSPRHTLERVDNDGDYAPENCRWALQQEQARNRRGTRLNEEAVKVIRHTLARRKRRGTMALLARLHGVTYATLLDAATGETWR